jgi:hypothetical protein
MYKALDDEKFKFTATFTPQFTKYIKDVNCIQPTRSILGIPQLIFQLLNEICSLTFTAVVWVNS